MLVSIEKRFDLCYCGVVFQYPESRVVAPMMDVYYISKDHHEGKEELKKPDPGAGC